jgi:hypothetical protein
MKKYAVVAGTPAEPKNGITIGFNIHQSFFVFALQLNQVEGIAWRNCQFQYHKELYLYIRLIISNGLTALGTNFVVPGMRCAAVLATPALVLHFQPFIQAFFLDQLHVPQYALPVRVLCIRNKLLHEFAGYQFAALIANLIAFALGTSLDAAGGAIPGGFFAFASIALLGSVDLSGPGCQQNRAGAAIHAAISIHYIIHS